MTALVSLLNQFFRDRIQLMAMLLVACFVSVIMLSSQSRASYPSYLLALLMLITFARWKDVFSVPLAGWACCLIIWLCSSAFWSEPFEARAAVSVWIRGMLVFFFMIAFAECQQRGHLQKWMGVALVSVGAAALLVTVINFYVVQPADGRLNGLGQLDTHVIGALVFGFIVLIALSVLMRTASVAWRIMALGTISLGFVAIWLSDSRTAWLAVPFAAFTFFLANKISDSKQLIVTLATVVLFCSVCFVALVTNDEFRDLVLPRGDSFRFVIWMHTLERILTSPIFGLGITTVDDIKVQGMTFAHPHNMYLSILFQGGVIGLGLYLILLFKTFKELVLRLEHDDAKLALSVFVLAVSSHLLDGHELIDKVGASWFLIWFPISVAVGFSWQKPYER